MADIVGVRFKRAGRIYYFDSAGIELEVNDHVVVETTRGLELGWVIVIPSQARANGITTPLKSVVRKAEAEDRERAENLEEKEKETLSSCAELIAELELPMKLLSAEYNLEGSRLTIFFSAEGRIDFRELVRQLSSRLKVRVELRQIGPRDETKLMGGFGRCGRPVCCATFLSELRPVSIKMAKEQNLPLNPMKISGICGRLLCCLGYEYEQYRLMKGKMLREGQHVSTATGMARVVGGNILAETVLVELENGTTIELPLNEVTILSETASLNRQRRIK
ncbi:MAG: stage 0 sporulation family protein [Dehalococcoidales bacterium]|jgi:cell fate regulator YaaT (PSP1 superfamily)|nr:stage 0 sporulation family protein [Dehalococcoidales bacterium]